MKLHNDKKLFSTLTTLAAKHLRMTPAFVEKDYWITLILYNLANSSYSDSVVFKGGTSLSKGYRFINRFSEDIDIAMIEENLSGNALKTKIRNIEKVITVGFTEVIEPNITSKGSTATTNTGNNYYFTVFTQNFSGFLQIIQVFRSEERRVGKEC